MSKCKSCGAEIKWVKIKISGNSMPVDARPEVKVKVTTTKDGRHLGELIPVYTSHFATCPDADKFRKVK
jgi:hypothetical protein